MAEPPNKGLGVRGWELGREELLRLCGNKSLRLESDDVPSSRLAVKPSSSYIKGESMEFRKLIEETRNSKEYKDFMDSNPEAYLVHVFFMTNSSPQIGFYSKKSKKVSTFEINTLNTSIVFHEEQPFQETEHDIKELELSKITIDFNKALEIANNIKDEFYKKEMVNRQVVILQHLNIGQIFNITFITQTFKTLNIKINAETEEVISHELANLIGL